MNKLLIITGLALAMAAIPANAQRGGMRGGAVGMRGGMTSMGLPDGMPGIIGRRGLEGIESRADGQMGRQGRAGTNARHSDSGGNNHGGSSGGPASRERLAPSQGTLLDGELERQSRPQTKEQERERNHRHEIESL